MNWVHTSASINRPVEDVWRFVSDFTNAPKWGLWAEGKGRQTSEGPVGLGSSFQWWEKILGKRFVYDLHITDWEPNQKLAFSIPKLATGEPGVFVTTLESVEGKSRMTIDVGFEMTGLKRVFRPVFSWGIRREKWATKVKDIIETQ